MAAPYKVINDEYKGVHFKFNKDVNSLTSEEISLLHDDFEFMLSNGSVRSIWVSIPEGTDWSRTGSILGTYFHTGIKNGKLSGMIHDLQENPPLYRFWSWKGDPADCKIPHDSRINIGATALLHDPVEDKICLVCPRRRSRYLNFPGGSMEAKRDQWSFVQTAKREASEELGINFYLLSSSIRSSSVIGIMEFPCNLYAGAINTIVYLEVPSLSASVHLMPDVREIEFADWYDVSEVIESRGSYHGKIISREITETLKAIQSGNKGLKISSQNSSWRTLFSA